MKQSFWHNRTDNLRFVGLSGSMLRKCHVYEEVREYATDRGNAEALWTLSEKLVGLTFVN